MCKCSKCNSINTSIVDYIDRIEDENLYMYQCEDCGYTFLSSVKLNNTERIIAILKEFKVIDIKDIKACKKVLCDIANISSQWDAFGFYNVYREDLDLLENYIENLEKQT